MGVHIAGRYSEHGASECDNSFLPICAFECYKQCQGKAGRKLDRRLYLLTMNRSVGRYDLWTFQANVYLEYFLRSPPMPAPGLPSIKACSSGCFVIPFLSIHHGELDVPQL